MQLQNKTAFITGGSSGLGFEITKLLLQKGMHVWICGRNIEQLRKKQQTLKSMNLHTTQCDVTDYAQVEKAVLHAGQIDLLINCAGVWIEDPLESLDPSRISQAIDINLKGVIFATKAVIGQMKNNNRGVIVNVSSVLGIRTRENMNVYSATKYGVQGFTESLKCELTDTNVKVIGFYPGGMQTDLFKKAGSVKDTTGWIDPLDMAKVLVFALERPDSMVMDHIVIDRTVKNLK